MKNVIVVCRADPKSSRWPRPIPSVWPKNSFRPFDSRDVRGATPGPAFVELAGEADIAGATRPCEADIPCWGSGWPLPLRNLLNRLISICCVYAGFHRQRLDRRFARRFFGSGIASGFLRGG